MDFIVEKQRQLHEDIDRLVKDGAATMQYKFPTQRSRINAEHLERMLAERIADNAQELLDTYEDKDEQRKQEIDALSMNPFDSFYKKLEEIKEYHQDAPNDIARPARTDILPDFLQPEALLAASQAEGDPRKRGNAAAPKPEETRPKTLSGNIHKRQLTLANQCAGRGVHACPAAAKQRREGQRDRDRDRGREAETEREREREGARGSQRERQRERERQTETEGGRHNHTTTTTHVQPLSFPFFGDCAFFGDTKKALLNLRERRAEAATWICMSILLLTTTSKGSHTWSTLTTCSRLTFCQKSRDRSKSLRHTSGQSLWTTNTCLCVGKV